MTCKQGLLLLITVFAAPALCADLELPKGPCGTKPPVQQQRQKGGEGVPPLPLPATPLRRSEKKRPPAPPPLIAKIAYGAPREVTVDGQTFKYNDWNMDPGDAAVLLNLANQQLHMNYTWKAAALSSFTTDPSQYPIYYYSGSEDFTLSDDEVARLREFIRNGGTIWGDTCYGNPAFFTAFLREMGKILPDRHFHKLAADHPLLNCFYQVKQVKYTRPVPDAPNGEPMLFGLDLGCRTAIVLSRYGLCCGWDGHIRAGAFNVDPNDARQIGINMISYALATHEVALYQATEKLYYEQDAQPRGDFVFAQARVGENWDCQANAIANLLKAAATHTSAEIKFERNIVDLASDSLMKYPFLYMTGHSDFKLADAEVNGLRNFLLGGGFLLASPCCGSKEFDAAFRREIARVLQGASLQPLPAGHPVYTILGQIKGVTYDAYAQNTGESLPALPLTGVSLGGTTSVVYCPYGFGGWRGFDHPFGKDISSEDAGKLGVNIILYSLTH